MNARKNVKATNIELTQEISNYLDKRLESIEKLIDPNDESAIFDIEVEKLTGQQSGEVLRAEINLKIAGKHLRAEATEETLFNAIDKARNDMLTELRRAKSKKRRMFRRGGTAIKGFMQSIGTGGGRLRDFARRRRK
ncbi:ribosome-associated translation inhibitor RaiA [bacterium]|nr:ribosome-associated translation inhibitor RaiA [bacterium]MBT3729940.1 ribosome-associated translation inhibitor RaiA [bacterium]MBT4894830.1 ribosome-associated translation inhibitor RaiA [bacterium]